MKESMDRNDKVFDIILEEAFDKYAKDVADYEPEVEMTEEDVRIMDSKKDNIYNNIMEEIDKDKKKKFPAKIIIPLVAVLTLGIITASFNVSAVREFWHRTYTSLVGTGLNINTEKTFDESYSEITKFKLKEKILIPTWLPSDMKLTRISDSETYVETCYNNTDIWITLKTEVISYNTNKKIQTMDNDYISYESKVLGMECNIVEITSESNLKIYVADCCSDNINYTLMTNGSKEMFEKILKNLNFFEE